MMYRYLADRMERFKSTPGPIDTFLLMRTYDKCLFECFPNVPGDKLIKGFQEYKVSIIHVCKMKNNSYTVN